MLMGIKKFESSSLLSCADYYEMFSESLLLCKAWVSILYWVLLAAVPIGRQEAAQLYIRGATSRVEGMQVVNMQVGLTGTAARPAALVAGQ